MTTWTEVTVPIGAYIYPDYIVEGYYVFDWEVPTATPTDTWAPTSSGGQTWT